jgi:FkbM family methyltransferase
MPSSRTLYATLPVQMEYPEEMAADIEAVLGGEYEAGFDGENLSIVDLGANVGAFSIWASLRWPNSTLHAYEPNPGTHAMLARNVAGWANIKAYEEAVYPGESNRGMLYGRFAGDGESGLVDYIGETFAALDRDRLVSVSLRHPRDLPPCDVLKIDVEGGEAAILDAMDVSGISLILLEYQDMRNRRAIEARLGADFTCEFVDCWPWKAILPKAGYRPSLADDAYGHLFFTNRRANRLRRASGVVRPPGGGWPVNPQRLSLRQTLAALPDAARRALASRLNLGS